MHFHRIAGQFYSRPLLLMPASADTISNFLLSRMANGSPDMRRGGSGEDDARESRTYFPAERGGDGSMTVHSPAASRFYGETPISEDGTRRPLPFRRTAEGVAIITCVGEWVNRGGYVGASSGVISYEGFKYQIEQVARDPRSRAVVIDMESPGGEAVGAFEAAAAVRRLAAIKPVWAVVNGLCASAAYAIASAATRIVSIPTGISGSIGVVLMHLDFSEYLKEEGVKPTFIHAGARKVDGNPYQALPDAVRERLQGEVDDFYAMFVKTVAAGRSGLSEKAIRDTEAGTFMGADALEHGLIDALGTFEDVLAELSSTSGSAAGRPSQSGPTMSASNTHTSIAALTAAGAVPGMIPGAGAAGPAADHAAALVAARAEGFAAGKAEGTQEGKVAGTAAERERVSAILGCDAAKGRGKLAAHLAFKTDMSPDVATEMLNAGAAEPEAGTSQAGSFEAEKQGRKELTLDHEAGKKVETAVDWDAVATKLNASLPPGVKR